MSTEPFDWREQAECRGSDTEVFFPPRGGDTEPAKAICAACPVSDPCLEWALRHEQHGVFGGMSEKQRRTERARLGIHLELPQADRDLRATVDQRPLQPVRCGTDAGYATHSRRGEPACVSCRAAHNAANQDRRAS